MSFIISEWLYLWGAGYSWNLDTVLKFHNKKWKLPTKLSIHFMILLIFGWHLPGFRQKDLHCRDCFHGDPAFSVYFPAIEITLEKVWTLFLEEPSLPRGWITSCYISYFLELKESSLRLLSRVWSFPARGKWELRTEQMCSLTKIKCAVHWPQEAHGFIFKVFCLFIWRSLCSPVACGKIMLGPKLPDSSSLPSPHPCKTRWNLNGFFWVCVCIRNNIRSYWTKHSPGSKLLG